MMSLDVTIALVIRETFSTTANSLKTILEHTPRDVKIIFIAAGVPDDVVDEVAELARDRSVEIVRIDHFLTPTQARNEAWKRVETRYIVFVDNDVIVSENWLEPLVRCAEEEDAAVVTPLIFERYPLWQYVHVAGGEGELKVTDTGQRICHQLPYFMHHDLKASPQEFKRGETTLVEFHTVLMDMDLLREMQGLDEKILCMFEEWDMCVRALGLKKRIFFEPASKVAYVAPTRPTAEDLRYFDLRWSEKWLQDSIERLTEKHQLTPERGNLKASKGFVKAHRLHKYGKLKKQLSGIFGRKVAEVFINRIVSRWDRHRNIRDVQADYERWKQYTEGLESR